MNAQGQRLPRLAPGSLDDDQKVLYEAIAGGRRAQGPQLFRLLADDGSLEGPFNAFLLQPRLGLALQAVGTSLRYESSLSDRAREIAILVVAAVRDSSFETYAHEAVGRHVGLSDPELDAVREHRYTDLVDALERLVATTAHELLDAGDLDDASFTTAVDALGLPAVFELLTLVGYYDALALQLKVFRVRPPDA